MGVIPSFSFVRLKPKPIKMELVSLSSIGNLKVKTQERTSSRKRPAALEQERVRRVQWGCSWGVAPLDKEAVININTVIT